MNPVDKSALLALYEEYGARAILEAIEEFESRGEPPHGEECLTDAERNPGLR